jgi:hypothetical protein
MLIGGQVHFIKHYGVTLVIKISRDENEQGDLNAERTAAPAARRSVVKRKRPSAFSELFC